MIYYRQKFLLSLLEKFDSGLSPISLQKLLFLATRLQSNKAYHFVPYKFGCYSFQAGQDINTLKKKGLLSEAMIGSKKLFLFNSQNESDSSFFHFLTKEDKTAIESIKTKYNDMNSDELIHYIYVNFPFFATKSEIVDRILNEEEKQKVDSQRRRFDQRALFTIGYEGKTLEEYLNLLIINDIHVLCDVRKHAYSQKFGFTKSTLMNACQNIDIEYIHMPELGIESGKRTNLNSQADYDLLFDEYERDTLPRGQKWIDEIDDLIHNQLRVALTCFEKNPFQCHRTRVARALTRHSQVIDGFTNL